MITSTVTLPFYKGFSSVANDDENATIFDTDGNFTQYNAYNINDEYGLISEVAYGAKKLAAQESERWDMDSPAFQGVAILRLAGSLSSPQVMIAHPRLKFEVVLSLIRRLLSHTLI